MADHLVLYCKVHQPLPLRLPAEPVPEGAGAEDLEAHLFDLAAAESAFRDVVAPAYQVALDALGSLAEHGVALSVGAPEGMVRLADRWAPSVVASLRRVLRSPGVDVVCAEPTESLLFHFDVGEFGRRMRGARGRLVEFARSRVAAAEVSGFSLNQEVYFTLGRLGFEAVAADDGAYAFRGHHPGHPSSWGGGPVTLYRMSWLSEELGFRLREGPRGEVRMADAIARAPGSFALVSFHIDDLAFGAHGPAHGAEVIGGLAEACRGRGVELVTMSTAGARARATALEESPPTITSTAGGSIEELARDGWWERLLFGRMQQAYQMASLARSAGVKAAVEWLLQRANLAVAGWAEAPAARPPTYWRGKWWEQRRSHGDTAAQVLAVLDNFIRAAARDSAQEAHR